MTEIDTYQTEQPRPHRTTELTEFLGSWQELTRFAAQIARTSFCPAELRPRSQAEEPQKVCEISAKMLAGANLGIDPLTSLRCFNHIQGTPTLSAEAMRGVVQSKGHQVEYVTVTDTECTVKGRRTRQDAWQELTWTIDRAKKAGYVGGKNKNWNTQPASMLKARATTEMCKMIASDALMGIPSSEEVYDSPEVFASNSDAPTVQAEPVAEEPPAAALAYTPEEIPSAPVTSEQLSKMSGLMGELGITPSDAASQASDIAERDLTRSSELTSDEAAKVIAAWEAALPQEDS